MLWLPLPCLFLPFLAPGAEAGVRQGVVTSGTTVSSGFSRLLFSQQQKHGTIAFFKKKFKIAVLFRPTSKCEPANMKLDSSGK